MNPLQELHDSDSFHVSALVRFAYLACAANTYATLIRLCDTMSGLADVLDSEIFADPTFTNPEWKYSYAMLTRHAYNYLQQHGSLVLRASSLGKAST